MLNVSLVQAIDVGMPSWRLISDAGDEIEPFTTFARAMVQQDRPYATREIYCRRVARFIDYLHEAVKILQTYPSPNQLLDLVHGYPSALAYGQKASDEIVKTICERLRLKPVSPTYSKQSFAALELFLALSERHHKFQQQVAQSGTVAANPLLLDAATRVNIPLKQRQRMWANSMLSGCIAGGPRMMERKLFSGNFNRQCDDGEDWFGKAFPYDYVIDLIRTPRQPRDRALYALLAASGCRISEALQVCISDINPSAGSVRLVSPWARTPGFYRSLTQQQIEKSFKWKGRKTPQTFLISPFAEEFWHHLNIYLSTQFIPGLPHPLLFQATHHRYRGEPLVLRRYSSVWDSFKQHSRKVAGDTFSPHSLRHMYGTYLINFAPNGAGGYGLKPLHVSQFMGHENPRTTERYARPDKELALQDLAYANAAIYDGINPKSMAQLRLEVAQRNLERLTRLQTKLDGD